MKYIIDKGDMDVIQLMVEIDTKLSLLEVKGDSVNNLFFARRLFKELFDSVKKDEDKEKEG